jgi:hypothetical protein
LQKKQLTLRQGGRSTRLRGDKLVTADGDAVTVAPYNCRALQNKTEAAAGSMANVKPLKKPFFNEGHIVRHFC